MRLASSHSTTPSLRCARRSSSVHAPPPAPGSGMSVTSQIQAMTGPAVSAHSSRRFACGTCRTVLISCGASNRRSSSRGRDTAAGIAGGGSAICTTDTATGCGSCALSTGQDGSSADTSAPSFAGRGEAAFALTYSAKRGGAGFGLTTLGTGALSGVAPMRSASRGVGSSGPADDGRHHAPLRSCPINLDGAPKLARQISSLC